MFEGSRSQRESLEMTRFTSPKHESSEEQEAQEQPEPTTIYEVNDVPENVRPIQWDVIDELGAGGMGKVYLVERPYFVRNSDGEDEIDGQTLFAAKTILHKVGGVPISDRVYERFQRELASIVDVTRGGSVHVVPVIDIGETDTGDAAIILPFYEDGDLHTLLKERRETRVDSAADETRDDIPFDSHVREQLQQAAAERAEELAKENEEYVANIAKQVCLGLIKIHAAGYVHRDIKPANLLTIQDKQNPDAPPTVLISDFGIVSALDHIRDDLDFADRAEDHHEYHDAYRLTATEKFMGTPAFAAPEIMRCEDFDHRADLYSVGLMMYQMLGGKHPYEKYVKNVHQLMYATTDENVEPWPLHQIVGEADESLLEQIIMQLLEKDPDVRSEIEFDNGHVMSLATAEDVIVAIDYAIKNTTYTED